MTYFPTAEWQGPQSWFTKNAQTRKASSSPRNTKPSKAWASWCLDQHRIALCPGLGGQPLESKKSVTKGPLKGKTMENWISGKRESILNDTVAFTPSSPTILTHPQITFILKRWRLWPLCAHTPKSQSWVRISSSLWGGNDICWTSSKHLQYRAISFGCTIPPALSLLSDLHISPIKAQTPESEETLVRVPWCRPGMRWSSLRR